MLVPPLLSSLVGTPMEKMNALVLEKKKQESIQTKILKNQWYETCIFPSIVRKK
jgi:hypothetical protein